MEKFLLIGLGNPGEKYKNTRHNIGFRISDALSSRLDVSFESRKYGDLAQCKICLLYTSPSPRDRTRSRMPSSA